MGEWAIMKLALSTLPNTLVTFVTPPARQHFYWAGLPRYAEQQSSDAGTDMHVEALHQWLFPTMGI